jgi:HK97 family phage major capsid protein
MHDPYPHEALRASELRRLQLIDAADAGPGLVEHMRALLEQSGPQKRRIGTSSLRDVARACARRDLTSTTAAAGGYLIGTEQQPLMTILDRFSVLRDAGVSVVNDLSGPVTIPVVTGFGGMTWLAADGSSTAENDPTIGQGAMGPKFASVLIDVSRQLMLQSAAPQVVGLVAGECIGRGIDAAILAGSGASGQPLGIVNASGTYTQSGTSLAASGLRAMRKAILLAGAREDRLKWIGAPDVQETLGSREFSTGSGRVLWADGKIDGLPAVATASMPAGKLVLGDFSRITVGVFDQAGASLEVNPYANFMAGISSFRLILPVDVLVSPAAVFAVAQAVT